MVRVNAADRQQQQERSELADIRRRQDVIDLQEALKFAPARRTIWRWIQRLRPLDRIFDDEPALMGYKASFHDVGVMLLNEIAEADPNAELLMMREQRERDRTLEAIARKRTKRK